MLQAFNGKTNSCSATPSRNKSIARSANAVSLKIRKPFIEPNEPHDRLFGNQQDGQK
jgi:hypothetical protein